MPQGMKDFSLCLSTDGFTQCKRPKNDVCRNYHMFAESRRRVYEHCVPLVELLVDTAFAVEMAEKSSPHTTATSIVVVDPPTIVAVDV